MDGMSAVSINFFFKSAEVLWIYHSDIFPTLSNYLKSIVKVLWDTIRIRALRDSVEEIACRGRVCGFFCYLHYVQSVRQSWVILHISHLVWVGTVTHISHMGRVLGGPDGLNDHFFTFVQVCQILKTVHVDTIHVGRGLNHLDVRDIRPSFRSKIRFVFYDSSAWRGNIWTRKRVKRPQ